MSKKWHDDIPDGGVLCKDSAENLMKIVPCDKDGDDYYALNDDEDCISSCGDGYHHDDLTPLTAAEIWGFMPWLDMSSLTAYDNALLSDNVNFCSGFLGESGDFYASYPFSPSPVLKFKPIKWLPLPQVSK